MAVYVVGDIQGCYKPLRRLLAKADFNPKKDQLWACGDLIGRGTQPLKTLDYLISLGHSFQTVLGNHDLHFLAVTAGVRPAKKVITLTSFWIAPISANMCSGCDSSLWRSNRLKALY
ncbi:metallophosphoesterase [Pseudobowmanella zhangzhouensis]|uniref:metallophosphoesterase n=1 Tax=Pseudobowmanella zhangzhouensis TaxID=1537679 RepID=UPI003610A689